MKNLRTLEEVFDQDGERFICCVAALPSWEHYDPNECPAPIREWVRQYYPDVVIEQLSGDFKSETTWKCDDIDLSAGPHWPKPIFRIGFNEQQVEHFQQEWQTLPPGSPNIPDDFYFLTYTFQEPPMSNEVPDSCAAPIPQEDQAPRDKVAE